MNRIVLFGRLAGRPKLAYTACGIAVVEFRLLVRKERRPDPPAEPVDKIDCVAVRECAQDLATWGDKDYRVNLEGRLCNDTYRDLDGRRIVGLRVYVDRAYFVDPVAIGLEANVERLPNTGLPVPIRKEAA